MSFRKLMVVVRGQEEMITFKAYAENQLNAKIKALQDDKAGEYMSAAFLKFTDDCGTS